jgi:hypothetical protein
VLTALVTAPSTTGHRPAAVDLRAHSALVASMSGRSELGDLLHAADAAAGRLAARRRHRAA